jgi:hypothetical protein
VASPRTRGQDREDAKKSGLAPDQWFNNVEVVTARRIGIETTTYVRNIYKYYVAYKLIEERERRGSGPVRDSSRPLRSSGLCLPRAQFFTQTTT